MINIKWRRIWSAFTITTLAASMSVGADGLSVTAAAVNDLDANRLLWLDFDSDDGASDGAVISDASSKNFDATVRGNGASFVDGKQGKAFNFTGDQHLDLGASQDLQPADLSVSFWYKPDAKMDGEQVFAWHKNSWEEPGWYLSSLDDDKSLVFSVTDEDGVTGEFNVTRSREDLFPVDEWTHIAVTYNTDLRMTSFYQNGIKIAETETARDAATVGAIGKSNAVKGIGWNGPHHKTDSLRGALDAFQLFAGTITPAQVRSLVADAGDAVPDGDVIAADMAAITLEKTLYAGTAPLPIIGPNGSQISWESSDTDVVQINGDTFTVSQPSAEEGDREVTITATFKLGETSDTKDIQAYVLAQAKADVED